MAMVLNLRENDADSLFEELIAWKKVFAGAIDKMEGKRNRPLKEPTPQAG